MTMSREEAASKASRSRSHESRVQGGKQAAAHNPKLSEAGRKGGQHSHGGGRRKEKGED